jgi:dephospho-CoA kinase
MLKVAVTGNIGSGKTTVCKVFEILGIPVFYADIRARKLLDDPYVKHLIAAQFGNEVMDQNEDINKKKLAGIVFRDKDKLEALNNIIHPRVYTEYDLWCKDNSHFPYTLQEAAIIFETGSYKKFDYIVLIMAPEEDLIKRVVDRDGVTAEEVLYRLSHQINQNQKKEMSDFQIDNNNHQLIIPKIIELHDYFSGIQPITPGKTL